MKERIRLIQEQLGLSQIEFANKLGISPASLSSIYTGRTNPTNNHVMAIHKAFPQINVNWLMFGEGDMTERGVVGAVLNENGEVDWEKGETMDVSNNGLAVYMNRWFDVGETCIFKLPRMGSATEGRPELEVVGAICWMREMPKGSPFRFVTGIQLRFSGTEDRQKMQEYVSYVKKRYKL